MIRAATKEDLNDIARLGGSSFAEVALTKPSYDRTIAMGIDTLKNGFALVVIEQGKIVGSIGLRRATWEHSGKPYLCDRWTFCEGTTRAFHELINGARAIAAQVGLPLYLGITRSEPSVAMRLYAMAGGTLRGALFEFPPLAADH